MRLTVLAGPPACHTIAASYATSPSIRNPEETMSTATPFLKNEDRLGPLNSRYVDDESPPWKPTPCTGIEAKIPLEDKMRSQPAGSRRCT